MTFCIECGAKAPDGAKFCPHCGSSLFIADTTEASAPVEQKSTQVVEKDQDVETPEIIETPEITKTAVDETILDETPVEVPNPEPIADPETIAASELVADPKPAVSESEPVTDPEPIKVESNAASADIPPLASASLAAAANIAEDAPKSKSGLFIGLGLVTFIAAGAGAYTMGLFDSFSKPVVKAEVSTPADIAPKTTTEIETVKVETPTTSSAQTAYGKAIRSGRISDLGQFAKDFPKSSLAKDAETAAFASLQRQGSVLAYNKFNEYFPEADTSAYTGLRPGEGTPASGDVTIEPSQNLNQPTTDTSSVRFAITSRAEELDPFIEQGDTGYVLSVVDELLALPNLNQSEATYLLNVRARAESSAGFTTSTNPEYTQPVAEPAFNAGAAAALAAPVPEVTTPEIAVFDTPAKPIERFGAITPDSATKPGECDMTFSVGVSGSPTNIVASCTDSIFIQPAKEAVGDWTYSPALLTGTPVQQDGLTVKLKFHLE